MTYDEVNKMAREAGCIPHRRPEYWNDVQIFATPEVLFCFANLVAAHEREECIAIAESKRHSPNFKLASIPPQNGTAVDIANLIRERGDKLASQYPALR